ncbi:hypothetical protein ACH5RR_038647 [Cinchona calisaya]|uniref:Uncharacterized protein n=1 Tax=Cinchona calisaya TaxID=153742 RepID=A0ABD2XZC8_9GENT
MSLMVVVFLLVLCPSLHACSARRSLGVIDKESVKGLQLHHKNVDPSIAERLRVQESLMVGIDRRTIIPSWNGANTLQEKNSEALGKGNEDDKGYNVILSSLQKVHETSKLKDQKRQARLIMESSSSPANAEETKVDSKENDMGEDIVVMDYAQPHRKPPIHNLEP